MVAAVDPEPGAPGGHGARTARPPRGATTTQEEDLATLNGKKIAILATDGFEQVELTTPRDTLRAEGADITIVSVKPGKIQGMNHDQKGDQIAVDATLDQVRPEQFDALILPGGVANPDYLRVNKDAVAFVKSFLAAGKPVSAVCHGPWMLIEAGGVKGKTVTSWPSLKTDLRNAGANWVDEQVVRDGMLVTSRKPDDLAAFCRETASMIASATPVRRAA
jgi:protease I